MQSTMILPCGVSSAPNRACAGVTLVTSVVSSPLRKPRAIGAGDLDHAAIGEKCRFHAIPCCLRERKPLMLAAQGRGLELVEVSMAGSYDLILKGGTVVNQDGEGVRDVAIAGGRIAAIGDVGSSAAEVIDCRGLHVLPGVIDSHVHMREPGLTHKEDLETRLARRGAGRRHGGVRDAQHRADHDDRRGAGRQGRARRITACIATSRSMSARRARTPTSWRCSNGCRAPAASRCSWARRPARC